MKKLLLFLLFAFPALCQVTGGTLTSSASATAVSTCVVTMPSVPANSLVLFSIMSDNNGVAQVYGTPTASGLTFASVHAIETNNNNGSIQIFRAYTAGALGSTAITSATWAEADDEVCAAVSFTNTPGTAGNNGSDAIGNTCSAQGNSTAPTCTVASSSHANSKYFGALNDNVGANNAITVGSGFTVLDSAPVWNGSGGFVNAYWEISTSPVVTPTSTAVNATIAIDPWEIQGVEILVGSGGPVTPGEVILGQSKILGHEVVK